MGLVLEEPGPEPEPATNYEALYPLHVHLIWSKYKVSAPPGPCWAPSSARERIHTSPVARAVLSAF